MLPSHWVIEARRRIAPLFSWTVFLPIAWLRFVRRYRLPDLRQLRDQCRALEGGSHAPRIICANHPNQIDGLILSWALGASRRPWLVVDPIMLNGPLKPLLQAWLGWTAKCVFVFQGGGISKNHRAKRTLEYLLRKNESILIFPSGTKSGEGPSYLIGALLEKFPEATVMGVRIGMDWSGRFWETPPRGTTFHLRIETIRTHSHHQGARGAWERSLQVNEGLS